MSESQFGWLARFETADALLAAARSMYKAGFRNMDAHTPYPIEGLADALDTHPRWVSRIAVILAALAAAGAYFMQWYAGVIDYPFVVGGKPLHSWPAFMLITFVCLLLAIVLGAVIAMLAGNRLPMLYHPVFNVRAFARASDDGFFLVITGGSDDDDKIRKQLEKLGAVEIAEVPE